MISISISKTIRFLCAVVLALGLANIAVQAARYIWGYDRRAILYRLLDINNESNLPTWYSVITLFSCGMLLAVIAVLKQQQFDRYTNHWQGLALLFLLFSLDEGASLHEKMMLPLRSMLNATGFLRMTWVIPGMIFVAIVALLYRRFVTHLPFQMRYLVLLAATLYVGGAIGLEMTTGFVATHPVLGSNRTWFVLAIALEELFEMLGIIVFIYALLSYLRTEFKDDRISIVLEK